MSDSGTNWQSRPLSELATTTSGGTPSRTRKDYYGGSIPWVKSGELNDDYIFETKEHITDAGLKNSSAKLFSSGTVLIALYGATVGKTSILRTEASTNQAVCGITPGPDLDADYLRYHLISLRRELLSHRYGGAQPNISQQIVRNQKIAYPPLPEQKKIAHILSAVQRAIEAQERIILTTTELKKALMHKLFTEGLRNEPQKQTEIGPVPESWEVVTLGDVINLFAGYAFKSKEGVADSNTQLLRMGNLYQNTLDLSRSPIYYPDSFADAHKRFVLKEGDLVMSLTGTSGKEDYGFTVRIPDTDKTLLLNQRVTRIDITDDRLQKNFAHHFLLSRKFLDFLYPTAKGMKQANLSTNAMKKLKVVLPGKEEQEKIADCFESLDEKNIVAERKNTLLQDLFRTLLHELMTAKIRVHDIDFAETSQAAVNL